MKCPNCGAEMKEGTLYCEHCGEDIHIVPDFEPEIEYNMEQTLHDIARRKMTRRRFGTDKKISVSRIRSASSHAGAHPLTAPKRTAITVEISVESRPIASDILPPYQIIEKISLPIVSVPNRNSRHGMTEQFFRSIYEGSFVMICPRKRQPSTRRPRKSSAATGRS